MKSEDVDGIMIVVAAAIIFIVILLAYLTDDCSMRGPCRCNEKRCETCGKVVAE